jgi:hypothetical protein
VPRKTSGSTTGEKSEESREFHKKLIYPFLLVLLWKLNQDYSGVDI